MFGHPIFELHQLNIFTENPSRVILRLKLIQEEVTELGQAIKDKNLKEFIDAHSDILYVTYGFGANLGLILDKSFELVHNSNMTKFCISEQEAIDTVQQYIKLYKEKVLKYL